MIGVPALLLAIELAFWDSGKQYTCQQIEPTIVNCSQQQRFFWGKIPGPIQTFKLKDAVEEQSSFTSQECDDSQNCEDTFHRYCKDYLVTDKGEIILEHRSTEGGSSTPHCYSGDAFSALLDIPDKRELSAWIGRPAKANVLLFFCILLTTGWLLVCVWGYGVLKVESAPNS